MASEGFNLPLSQQLLRRLKVAGVQIPHKDNGVWVLVLHLTEGLSHEIHSLRDDVVALTAERMRAGCNERIAIGFSPQGCPVDSAAGRERNEVAGNVLPLVSPDIRTRNPDPCEKLVK